MDDITNPIASVKTLNHCSTAVRLKLKLPTLAIIPGTASLMVAFMADSRLW
jgi:hypothetical protein